MKIRNNKKKIQYLFWEFEKGGAKVFSKKTELLKYLNRIGERALNGHVKQECDHLNSFYGVRQWFVWYNEKKSNLEIELRQQDFRGKKFMTKHRVEKENVKYFIFSDKIISLMAHIADGKYTDSNLKNLLVLFHKRGFRDFELEEENLYYYNRENHKNLEVFNEWSYWSDRCNFLRCKIIHDMIKRDRPEAFKHYLEKI